MKRCLLLPLLLLASCSLFKDPEGDENKEAKTRGPDKRIVGRIASVSHARKFVLIQRFGTGILPTDQTYQSRGPEGRTASLRPSGERIRDFYAADLVSGEVQKGDAVVAYPKEIKEEPGEEETDDPETPETPNEEDPTENTEPELESL